MVYQVQVTIKLCANVDPVNRKQFLNPSTVVITITEKKKVGSPLAHHNKQVLKVDKKRPYAVFYDFKLTAP